AAADRGWLGHAGDRVRRPCLPCPGGATAPGRRRGRASIHPDRCVCRPRGGCRAKHLGDRAAGAGELAARCDPGGTGRAAPRPRRTVFGDHACMSIRVGFDVDGVIANFNKTFRETAAKIEGGAGSHNRLDPAGRALAADALKRVWDHISRTSQWWLQLEAYEPEQIQRLYKTS